MILIRLVAVLWIPTLALLPWNIQTLESVWSGVWTPYTLHMKTRQLHPETHDSLVTRRAPEVATGTHRLAPHQFNTMSSFNTYINATHTYTL